jgi:hypothetical protein
MWATGLPVDSPWRRGALEALWVAFAVGNLIAVIVQDSQIPVPFHLIWVSFTLLYGVRVWSLRVTLVVTAIVCLSSGCVLSLAILDGRADPDEFAEIPLMAMIFGAMVWHARRRNTAMQAVQRLSDERSHLLDRQVEFTRCIP